MQRADSGKKGHNREGPDTRASSSASENRVTLATPERRRDSLLDELQTERTRFRSVLEQLPFAVVVAEAPGGRIVFWNDEALRIYGGPPRQPSSFSEYPELLPAFRPDGTPFPSEEYPIVRALLEGEQTSGEEVVIVRTDGTRCPVLVSAGPVCDQDGKIVAAVGTFYDITEAKLAEREHEDLARRQRAARIEAEAAHTRLSLLAEISQFLLASLDYKSAVTGLVRMILPVLGDACFVHMEGPEGPRRVAVAHINPYKGELLQELDELQGLTELVGGPLATALRTGKPERGDRVVPGMWKERPDGKWQELVARLDPRAFLVIPLVTRGRVLGAMVFLVTESDRKYSVDDLDFAQHVARRAATAVDNLTLFEEARQAREAAEEANRLKDEFLATLSHELRTPLNAILGWARMLSGRRLDEPTREKGVMTIERNALAQAQIVDDLLDVSRIITGGLRLHLQPVDLSGLVDAAIDAVRPAAQAKGIRVEAAVQRFEPIAGDQGRLQQVIWNLVSNAVKFTLSGGRIDVRMGQRESEIVLTVSDTGVGISPEFLPQVFQRFRQADSTTTRVHGGLGLGLAIVRHLVELHGGTVEAHSKGIGQGATFTVHLPIRKATEITGESPGHESRPRRPGPGVPAESVPLIGVQVLVVDDDADGRDLVASILRHHGANVETASSVRGAFDALARFTPRVVVADIAMPEEDGYALISRLRSDGHDVRAIALTAYARAEDRRRALEAGFDFYLAKPVEPSRLVDAVAALALRRPLASRPMTD